MWNVAPYAPKHKLIIFLFFKIDWLTILQVDAHSIQTNIRENQKIVSFYLYTWEMNPGVRAINFYWSVIAKIF